MIQIYAQLTEQQIADIYELTYKSQILNQEEALGDYGAPQVLPDAAYLELLKIEDQLLRTLNRAMPEMWKVYHDWITKHNNYLWDMAVEYVAWDIHGGMMSRFFKVTLEEYPWVADVFESVDLSEDVQLFPYELEEVEDIIKKSREGRQAIRERAQYEKEEHHPESLTVENVEKKLRGADSLNLDEKVILFQEALHAAHWHGEMADHLLMSPTPDEELPDGWAKEILDKYSEGANVEQWNADLTKILGYEPRSRLRRKGQVTDDEHILEIAYEVREQIIGDHGCTQALCLKASMVLEERLKELGYDASIVKGKFVVDHPVDLGDPLGRPAWRPDHYWIEIGGKILDITADQFEAGVFEEDLDEVVYGDYTEYPRYNVGEKNFKEAQTIPLGECYSYTIQFINKLGPEKSEDAMVVHGKVYDKWKDQWYDHAWVEYEGKAYDWQTSHRDPLTIEDFYEIYTPEDVKQYFAETAMINALRSGHYGPWGKTAQTDIGQRLRAILNTEEAYKVLGPEVDTWISGGCGILAFALLEVLDMGEEDLFALVSRSADDPDLIQHFVVKYGDKYLDGDGLSSTEQLLDRWKYEERLEDVEIIHYSDGKIGDIMCPTHTIADVVALLEPLRRTAREYHGTSGAGVLLHAQDTDRYLIALRSSDVMESGTWGIIGGKVDDDEDPEQAARRELLEETGYTGPISLSLIHVFEEEDFTYHNFLGTIPEEEDFETNWETDEFLWVSRDELNNVRPLHYGLEELLGHI